jgi:MFS family permease
MKKNQSYASMNGDEVEKVLEPVKPKPDARCDIYRKENMAITMSYLSVGLVMSLIQTPLNVYLVSVLDAEPALQNTIAILQTLPWSLKLVFGFLSDSCPIYGMQRKPYLTIGALLYSFAFITYGMCGINSTPFLALCIFVGTLGLIMVDVMADTMCVQRSRFETEEHRGQMQASFYSVRFAGGLIGAMVGAVVCNKEVGLSFHHVAFCIGVIPFILIVPWLFV